MKRRDLHLGLLAMLAGRVVPASGVVLPGWSREPARWLNGAPLEADAIAGRPVLIEFWTYGCSNCRNTLPWVKSAYARFSPRGLVLVGVHTPEFPAERDPRNVRRALQALGIAYPVLLDPDEVYWTALANHYWPAFHLFDRDHRLVTTRIGELHVGQPGADSFARAIEQQLAR